MKKYIDKLVNKIREITNSDEGDATKILAGLMILGIAISWFVLGAILIDDDNDNKNIKIDPKQYEHV